MATLMITGTTFSTAELPLTPMQVACMCREPYMEVISSVLWPVVVSQTNVAFSMSTLSQFIQNPGPAHWKVLKCIIVYIRSTKDLWFTFSRQSKPTTEGFCDMDWEGQKHCHSISGYLFHMGARAILWSSKKQHVVALLSTEWNTSHKCKQLRRACGCTASCGNSALHLVTCQLSIVIIKVQLHL